ncbi:MAG: LPS export ABC transporter permease LptG [Pseudomonadota bacterium]
MRILSRYIGRTVLVQTLMVMAVLLTIYFFITLMDELAAVGQGRYSIVMALQYALMLLPRQLYELFPMVALLGGMLGLGTLASSNELTVIRAAGVSVRRIMLAMMKMALLLMLAVALIGELAAPQLEQKAQVMRAQALNKGVSLNVRGGLWVRDGDTYINVRRLLPEGTAYDVSLYVFDKEQRLLEMISARSAVYDKGQWVLRKVTRSRVDHAGVVSEELPRLPWRTVLSPAVISVAALPPDKLSIAELAGYVDYTRSNSLDARVYELALWTRVVAPFATAGMMLLAVPFIFGSLRSVSIGLRITVGGLLGIGFHLFNGVFGRIALVYDLSPLLSAAMPTLVVYGLWWGLMRRVQ